MRLAMSTDVWTSFEISSASVKKTRAQGGPSFLATISIEGLINWRQNGGHSTLKSYRATSPNELPIRHLDWMRSLPLFHDDGQRYFVHAGVHPARPLHQQRPRDLLWIREPFLSSDTDLGRLIVHGHTPISSGAPELRNDRLNLDTGAVYGRALTSAVFAESDAAPLKFLWADRP